MRVKPSEKLFYNQFTHKVLLREKEHGCKLYAQAVEKIREWIALNNCKCKERRSATSMMGMVKDQWVLKGPQKEGLSICFSDIALLNFIQTNYSHVVREVNTIMSDKHANSLTDGVRVRVRSLFQGKFKFKVKFSRFKARNLGYDLGTQMKQSDSTGLLEYNISAANGEVQDFFLSKTNDLQIINDWDVTVYCNSVSLITMARLKFDEIITELVQAQPIEELT